MVKDNSLSSKILDIVIYISLIILMIIFLPVEFNLEAYKVILEAGTVPRSFVNSVIYTVVYTAVSLLFTTTMAYPLSRSKDRVAFKGFFSKIVIFTMFFNAGIIPNYLVVKGLGLMNSMWALILPSAISTYNLVVMRSFFEGIPVDLEEAACDSRSFLRRLYVELMVQFDAVFAVGYKVPSAAYHKTDYYAEPDGGGACRNGRYVDDDGADNKLGKLKICNAVLVDTSDACGISVYTEVFC